MAVSMDLSPQILVLEWPVVYRIFSDAVCNRTGMNFTPLLRHD